MLNSAQTQKDGLIFIYDMTNSSYGNFDYELCVKILNLLKVMEGACVALRLPFLLFPGVKPLRLKSRALFITCMFPRGRFQLV